MSIHKSCIGAVSIHKSCIGVVSIHKPCIGAVSIHKLCIGAVSIHKLCIGAACDALQPVRAENQPLGIMVSEGATASTSRHKLNQIKVACCFILQKGWQRDTRGMIKAPHPPPSVIANQSS